METSHTRAGNYCGVRWPEPHRFRFGRNVRQAGGWGVGVGVGSGGVESFLVEQKEGVQRTWRRLAEGKPGLGFL